MTIRPVPIRVVKAKGPMGGWRVCETSMLARYREDLESDGFLTKQLGGGVVQDCVFCGGTHPHMIYRSTKALSGFIGDVYFRGPIRMYVRFCTEGAVTMVQFLQFEET